MPSFLSIPLEIRTMIWQDVVEREIHACNSSCAQGEGSHESSFRIPNANLLLICRQAKDEIESLHVHYRFQVENVLCCEALAQLLNPNQLARSQFIYRWEFFSYSIPRHGESWAWVFGDWLKWLKGEYFDYEDVQIEDQGVDDRSQRMLDFVFTF
jgi:hypothetical protein